MDHHARLWEEFSSLLRAFKDLNSHALEETGVGCELAGAHVLTRLELLGPVRLTDLALALGLDPSSVSRQVSSLERAGWVAREKDPHDQRAQRLHLTPAGNEAVAGLQRSRARALERLTPGWDARDFDDLTDRLARLNHDLEANRALLGARQETA
jgi:DNA-binding MarR family transcriptional regulator